jgi:magnesium and cobalt transporter
MLAGRVPSRGEIIPHPGGITFEVLDADPRRVKRLRMRGLPRPAAPAEPEIDSKTASAGDVGGDDD